MVFSMTRAIAALALVLISVHTPSAYLLPGRLAPPLLRGSPSSLSASSSATTFRNKAYPTSRRPPALGAMMSGKGGGSDASEKDIKDVVDGIAQVREGLEAIRGGLGIAAGGATTAFQDSVQQALGSAEALVGPKALESRLWAAMDAVADQIGIDEDGVPPVEGGPLFDLRTAVWLAGTAFDSYNDPTGGLKKVYDDGTSVSYMSSNAISSLHNGVLMIKLKGAGLVAGAGLLGSESSSCDPFATISVSGTTMRSKTVKQTMNPGWEETYVVYTDREDGADDELKIQVFDADIPFGKDDMNSITPDPLIGTASIKVSRLIEEGKSGFTAWSLNLEPPETPTTFQDIENANNPYWVPVPRQAMIQSWASLAKGGASGGLVELSAQFFPLEPPSPSPSTSNDSPSVAPPSEEALLSKDSIEALAEGDWNLLANWPVEGSENDERSVLAREGLERICFIDNDETDTQASVWKDEEDKRLVIAFRGTEQVKWKDLLTDALLVQHPFEPGAPEQQQQRLPPLLESASQSLGLAVSSGESSADGQGLLDAGVLGSVIGGLATKEGIEAVLEQAGKETKNVAKFLEGYKFGDLTKGLLAGLSEAQASDDEIGKRGYQFGDITKGLIKNIQQAKGESGGSEQEDEGPMVHLGFLRGYMSVRARLTKLVEQLIPGEDDEWSIYVTGHSLGGALSTLCAADFASIFPKRRIVMYNYGSPRVGNAAFVELFNRKVEEAFRVVNDADVVARVPRSRGFAYHHVGRTALVSKAQGGSGRGSLWVEGESDGVDPLRDRWSNLSDLVEAEVALLQGLIKGESLGDHMEDAYYAALKLALSTPASIDQGTDSTEDS